MFRTYKIIRNIFNEVDPMGLIALGAPIDEYDIEIFPLIEFLQHSKELLEFDIYNSLSRIFSEKFSVEDANNCQKDLETISKEIIKLKDTLVFNEVSTKNINLQKIETVLSKFNIMGLNSHMEYKLEAEKIRDVVFMETTWDDMKLGFKIQSILENNFDQDYVRNIDKDIFFQIAEEILK